MYTKEQIRKGIESALFSPKKREAFGSPVDAILSEIERLAKIDNAYVQPLSIEITESVLANGGVLEYEMSLPLRKELRLTIEMTAAFVHNRNEYSESVEKLKSGFNYVCGAIMNGEIQIRTTNTNINPNCHLIPTSISFNKESGKILLEVIFYGDTSDYILYNKPRLDLIRLSILDGRLVVKSRI